MLLHIPAVLTPDELKHARALLLAAPWHDGRATAGQQAVSVKHNLQLAPESDAARELAALVRQALFRHPLYMSAALPQTLMTPMFNCYQGGMTYGNHVDNAIRRDPLSGQSIRTDVSCTLFFSDPEEYEGGELVVEDTYGAHSVRLPAGDAILYPSTSLHRVEPVTAGARLASFMWTQSMVRSDSRRAMLFDIDMAILQLRQKVGDCAEVMSLTATYHNLLREWAEV
ncbi:Fe2+-dependent dioxygenase [Vogesella urethralis]|jgi:PKHD-type hydroxylase|uniref:Fe2+-dependent dioxygenase n=1 Tax=Vogesella urethralis TaxID=2592656 RepID=UPI001186FE0C|nr:Fe2+-dependent dioxygenase [Vogesella urethralis]